MHKVWISLFFLSKDSISWILCCPQEGWYWSLGQTASAHCFSLISFPRNIYAFPPTQDATLKLLLSHLYTSKRFLPGAYSAKDSRARRTPCAFCKGKPGLSASLPGPGCLCEAWANVACLQSLNPFSCILGNRCLWDWLALSEPLATVLEFKRITWSLWCSHRPCSWDRGFPGKKVPLSSQWNPALWLFAISLFRSLSHS